MGGQSAKQTNDRDTDVDTKEASSGTCSKYGKDPRPRKETRALGEFIRGGMGKSPRLFLEI